MLSGRGDPVVVRGPPALLGGAQAVRSAVRSAAAGGPAQASQLVPALVTGDDSGLSQALLDDFRTAGLTHLTAVSGTNLTLVLAFLLLLARWARVRGRGLLVVGLLGGRRVRADGAPGAVGGAGRGDGHRRAPRAGRRGPRGRGACTRRGRAAPAGRGPLAGQSRRGSRSRRSRPRASSSSHRASGTRWRGGCRGRSRRRSPYPWRRSWPAHPSWRRCRVRSASSRSPPTSSRRPRSGPPRCSAWSAGWWVWCSRRWAAPSAGSRAWCAQLIVVVAEHSAAPALGRDRTGAPARRRSRSSAR